MKGLIFTEFLEMVEEKFSAEMVENIIEDAHLPNGGAYTEIGTYDHSEIVRLVTSLSNRTDISAGELQTVFGNHLFKRFVNKYGTLITNLKSAFELLSKVDDYIHVEVLKLYPDAELPRFTCKTISENQMEMLYLSKHPFSDLARGLIQGCAEHFKENIHIDTLGLPASEDRKHKVRFTLTKCS
jgi:hypothetical protein